MFTHPWASQGTPAAILTQPSLSRKGHLLALTKINPSDDLLLPSSTHAFLLERRLEATRSQCTTSDLPKVIFTFSHILLPPFALSCWNNGIFRVEKNMLPTSKQGSNGKEDFMCIKPWVYIHASAVQPQLCHTSR